MDEIIQELLDEYRMPYLCDASELTTAEFEAAEEKSYAARQTLESTFSSLAAPCNSNDERSPGFDLETMKDKSKGVYEDVLNKLRKWAHKHLWPEGLTERFLQRKASTVEEVCEFM